MDFLLHTIVLIGTWLPSLLGYNLLFGKGKVLHFGPLAVSLVSAYVFVLLLKAGSGFLVASSVALVASLLVSAFFAWLSFRLEPDGLGVMSIAVHLSVLAVVLNWNTLTRGALGIPRVPRLPFLDSVLDFAIASVVVSAFCILVVWWVDRGTFGRKLQALAEHDWHAKALGINRKRVHLVAFLIAGIGTTIANVLFVQYLLLLHPNDYQFMNFVFWIMVIVAGKPGSVVGVTLSTILLVFLREGLRFVPLAPDVLGPLRLMLFGMILFAAVFWRRDTLFPHERRV